MDLLVASLERYAYMPTVTLGRLTVKNFSCHTLECPWVGNMPYESCAPEGYWACERFVSPKHGATFQILIPDRTVMLFHSANWVDQLHGCIAPGEYVDPKNYSSRGAMVSRSRLAMDDLLEEIGDVESLRLHITSFSAGFSL